MKSLIVLIIALVLTLTLFSCKKCFDCKKRIIIENEEGELVPTDGFYEEEACAENDKNNLQEDGFICTAQL